MNDKIREEAGPSVTGEGEYGFTTEQRRTIVRGMREEITGMMEQIDQLRAEHSSSTDTAFKSAVFHAENLLIHFNTVLGALS